MAHWTQTPEGKKKLSEQAKKYLASPQGKVKRAKMTAGLRRHFKLKRKIRVNGAAADAPVAGNWSSTPEGRQYQTARARAHTKTSAWKRQHKAMMKGLKRAVAERREARLNGHAPDTATLRKESGRQMLVALALEGAVTRRQKLVRELEKLDLFLAKSGGQA